MRITLALKLVKADNVIEILLEANLYESAVAPSSNSQTIHQSQHRITTSDSPTMTPSPGSDIHKHYFDDPTLSDLTIRLSDRTVHVHRIVLFRRSAYFEKLILGGFKVSRTASHHIIFLSSPSL